MHGEGNIGWTGDHIFNATGIQIGIGISRLHIVLRKEY